MVKDIISVLTDDLDNSKNVMIGFDLSSAHVIAMLIDIGVAPMVAPIADEMRKRAAQFNHVKLIMEADVAPDFARHIEIGLARHEMGVNSASEFRLH